MRAVRSIGIRELKSHTSAVLREVATSGEEIVVTIRGRPIARIEPVRAAPAPTTDGMGGLRGALSTRPTLEWEDFAIAARAWEPRSLPDD